MKNHLKRSMIIGFLVLLTIAYFPRSSEVTTSEPGMVYFLKPQNLEEALPIETTLPRLANSSVKSYFGDTSPYVEPENPKYVEYNLETGIETVLDRIPSNEIAEINPTLFQPQKGITPQIPDELRELLSARKIEPDFSIPDSSWVIDDDNRSVVADTEVYPFSSIVKVSVQAGNGDWYMGSGAVIDETHVLTCAHVAYMHDEGGWIQRMYMYPGQQGGYRPYGSAQAVNIRLYSEWVDGARVEDDWALVTMDQPLGVQTGWMGIATYSSGNPVYVGELETAGYPGDINNGATMINTTDVGAFADSYNHHYWLDTYGGQSGSPVWHVNATGEYILTVNAYEVGPSVANFGTRINAQKYSQLYEWIAQEDAPTKYGDAAVSHVVLSVGAWATVTVAETEMLIQAHAWNKGTLSIDELTTNFYLSDDNNITVDDYLLGSATTTDVDVMEFKYMQWRGEISESVPAGMYYVGWVTDPDDLVEEYDETDNSGSFLYQIIVKNDISDPGPDPDPEDLTFMEKLQDFVGTPWGLTTLIGGGAIIVAIPILVVSLSILAKRKKKAALMGTGN